MNKITEKTAAESVKGGASFLITQTETVNGAETEALRRAGRDLVEKALVEPKYLGLYNAVFGADGGYVRQEDLLISQTSIWGLTGGTHVCIPCKAGDKVVITANGNQKAYYAFLASDTVVKNRTPDFAGDDTGRQEVSVGSVSEELTAPEGTNWLYLHHTYTDGTTLFYPCSVTINGMEQAWSAARANAQTRIDLQQITKAARLTTEMVEWVKGAIGTAAGAESKTELLIRSKWFYLIDPEGDISFTGTAASDRTVRFAFFDARLRFISYRDVTATGPFEIPAGACFVRFAYGFKNNSGQTVDGYGGVDAVAADWGISYVSPMEKKDKLIDDLMAQNGIVAYWANGKNSMSTASVVQEFSAITLNGYSSGNALRIALSGTLAIGTGTWPISDTPNTIRLKAGHTYKVKIEALGGEVETAEGATFRVQAGLYTGSSSTSVMPSMAALTSGVSLDWQTFTPETDGDYKLAMLANANNTYTNFKVRVVLTDITEWVSA